MHLAPWGNGTHNKKNSNAYDLLIADVICDTYNILIVIIRCMNAFP
jgi:hypothetical protein